MAWCCKCIRKQRERSGSRRLSHDEEFERARAASEGPHRHTAPSRLLNLNRGSPAVYIAEGSEEDEEGAESPPLAMPALAMYGSRPVTREC